MRERNLNLGTDYIEGSAESFQFPEDTFTNDEVNARFDELLKEFFG